MNNTATPSMNDHITTSQPAREANIAAIISFYESGIKELMGEVGIELEHTIVAQSDLAPVSYRQEHGVKWILEQLQEDYPTPTFDAQGDLIGVFRKTEAVTIEPAAQLELSAGPFKNLATAEACFMNFEEKLTDLLAPSGKKVLTIGYHPTARARDLELIPKRRYKFMDLYLGEISEWGPRMMRCSASTQVSIDYSSVDDALRKFRLAYALVPILSLISDNAPIFEGKPSPHHLMRTEIWKYCDPDRCGQIPGVMDQGFSLRSMAEYILDTPAILVPCKKNEWCYSEKTFGSLYAETPMDQSDVEHALSMFFNDVRMKTYIEIRPADAMPIPYVIAYAALIKGLFAESSLDAMDELFADVAACDIDAAKEALMAQGYEAIVYSQPVAELADRVIALAERGLSPEETPYLAPLAELIASRTTLADLAIAE